MKKPPIPEVVGSLAFEHPRTHQTEFSISLSGANPVDGIPYRINLLKRTPGTYVVPVRDWHHLSLLIGNNSVHPLTIPIALLHADKYHSIFGPDTGYPDFNGVVKGECWEVPSGDTIKVAHCMKQVGGHWRYSTPFKIDVRGTCAVIQPHYGGIVLDVGTMWDGMYYSLIENGPLCFVLEPVGVVEQRYYELAGSTYGRWFS